MANFLCALDILSALQATQSGEQLAKVLIPNAVRLGGEGPVVASSMGDWVAWVEVGDFLTMTAFGSHPPRCKPLRRRHHRHSVHDCCPTRHPRCPAAGSGPRLLLDGYGGGSRNGCPPGRSPGDRSCGQRPGGRVGAARLGTSNHPTSLGATAMPPATPRPAWRACPPTREAPPPPRSPRTAQGTPTHHTRCPGQQPRSRHLGRAQLLWPLLHGHRRT